MSQSATTINLQKADLELLVKKAALKSEQRKGNFTDVKMADFVARAEVHWNPNAKDSNEEHDPHEVVEVTITCKNP